MLVFSPDVSMPLTQTPVNTGWDGNFSLRFSPVQFLEVGLNAYTPADYVLGASYQVYSSGRRLVEDLAVRDSQVRVSRRRVEADSHAIQVAVGIHDVGL